MNIVGAGQSIPGFHQVADSINVIAGTPTGTVADIQTWQDGNTLDVVEAAATPGMDIEINFTNVKSIRRVGLQMVYEGSAVHWIEVQLWNYDASAWKTIWTFSTGLGQNYRYSDLPEDGQKFIDTNGDAMMRIYHPTGGNASHDAHIEYAALIR